MFEKVSQMAEQAAISTSRRHFLGQLGRGALIAAGAMAGLLAMPQDAAKGDNQAKGRKCPPKCFPYRGICFCPR
jgi:hypothetical protein